MNPVVKFPPWLRILNALHWIFCFLALCFLNLPWWASVLIAAVYIGFMRVLPGLGEKGLLLLQLISLGVSIANHGILSWFTAVFGLFVVWYIASWIANQRWQKSLLLKFSVIEVEDDENEIY